MIGGPAVVGSGTPPSLPYVGQLSGPKNAELYVGQQPPGNPVAVVNAVVIWPPPAIGKGVGQSGSDRAPAATAETIFTSVLAADAIAAAPVPVVSVGSFVITTVGAVQIPVGGVVTAMLATEPVAISSAAAKVPPEHVTSEIVTIGGAVYREPPV